MLQDYIAMDCSNILIYQMYNYIKSKLLCFDVHDRISMRTEYRYFTDYKLIFLRNIFLNILHVKSILNSFPNVYVNLTISNIFFYKKQLIIYKVGSPNHVNICFVGERISVSFVIFYENPKF